MLRDILTGYIRRSLSELSSNSDFPVLSKGFYPRITLINIPV